MADLTFNLPGAADLSAALTVFDAVTQAILDGPQDPEADDLLGRFLQIKVLLETTMDLVDELEEAIPKSSGQLEAVATGLSGAALIVDGNGYPDLAAELERQAEILQHLDMADVDFIEPEPGEIERQIVKSGVQVPKSMTLREFIESGKPLTKRDVFNLLPTDIQDMLIDGTGGDLDRVVLKDINTGKILE